MKTNELQTILGYLNIGLAIAHDTGVTVGHFGDTDFIQLAQSVNSLLLNSIEPAASSTVASSTTSTVSDSTASSTTDSPVAAPVVVPVAAPVAVLAPAS